MASLDAQGVLLAIQVPAVIVLLALLVVLWQADLVNREVVFGVDRILEGS